MTKDPRNSGGAYLPERYRQHIEAKKRRRLLKKIAVACIIVVVVAAVYGLLSGALVNPSVQNPPQPPVIPESYGKDLLMPLPAVSTVPMNGNMSGIITPLYGSGIDLTAEPAGGMLSLDDAIMALRQDYPESSFTLFSVNLTDRYAKKGIYEFRINQADFPLADPGFTVFIDAFSGDPYTPGQEVAGISSEQAKNIVREVFSISGSDRIRIRYENSPYSVRAWAFTVEHDNSPVISGSLDPDTGQIASFSRTVEQFNRQSYPLLDILAARGIADRYIIRRNGAPLPVNMSVSYYEPLGLSGQKVAGNYVFVYDRIVQDIPCDYDGFTISVDSVTGDINEYNRRWNSPDNAFSIASDPLVKRYEAIFSVQQKAQEIFPASASGLKIISAEIRWRDLHPPGVIPRPGSISTAWKVQFEDDIIRSRESPVPATGWVDARTGKILDFYYQH